MTGFGYGVLRDDVLGEQSYAHRVAFRVATGASIPDGLLVRHRCDTPACVNPAHLELGTDADNVADKVKRGRHLRGSALKQAKHTEAQIAAAKRLIESGLRPTEAARRLGLKPETVRRAHKGIEWKHVA